MRYKAEVKKRDSPCFSLMWFFKYFCSFFVNVVVYYKVVILNSQIKLVFIDEAENKKQEIQLFPDERTLWPELYQQH